MGTQNDGQCILSSRHKSTSAYLKHIVGETCLQEYDRSHPIVCISSGPESCDDVSIGQGNILTPNAVLRYLIFFLLMI
jgi:hypothetical protein